MTFQQHAQEILKSQRYRITQPRRLVLDVLSRVEKPLNAYDIADEVRKEGFSVDTSTVYRILEVYMEHGLVHLVKDCSGYVKCQEWQCSNEHHCHHQFVCKKCSSVTELHVDDREFMGKLKRKLKGVKVEEHYIELMGVCGECC